MVLTADSLRHEQLLVVLLHKGEGQKKQIKEQIEKKLQEMLLSTNCSDGHISKVNHFRLFQWGPRRSKIIIFAWLDTACSLPHAYCDQGGFLCWAPSLVSRF